MDLASPVLTGTSRPWIWSLLGVALLGVVAWGVHWAADRAPEPSWEVPDFRLTAEDGTPFSRQDLAGTPWLAGFVFTRCSTICPRITARMATLQGEVRLVTFTVDPGYDTPEVLSAYAGRHGARRPHWRFLTGPREVLYRLIGQGFKLSVAPNPSPADAGDLITHSDRLVLVDGEFRVRGTYSSSDSEAMERLKADLEALE